MIRKMNFGARPEKDGFAEGDLYKVLQVRGRSFPLYYGFYDACDRANSFAEPMPIYPNFLEEPHYTEEGLPFVTKMQDACSYYRGVANGCEECAECMWYQHGDELLGVCGCPENRQTVSPRESGEEYDR